MHDNIILHNPNIILLISNAFFLFTFNNQYIVRKLHYTLFSTFIAIYFTSTWSSWEIYVASTLGILLGFFHSFQTQKKWKPANSTFFVYFNVILPIYSVALFPLVIPQTDIAMGVGLAFLVWFFISILFYIFYKRHPQILDRHIIYSNLVVFLLAFFLHRWFWLNFALLFSLEILGLGFHGIHTRRIFFT